MLKESNQNSSNTITPTSSKTKTQSGSSSKSTTTPNTNKKATASPDDQGSIIEQQQQIIDKLLQRVNILEGKLSELEEKILVTQRVSNHFENMIYRQKQYSRSPCVVVNGMTEPSAKDDRDVDNIATTLEKETGIGKDIILTNIGKTHPI